MKTAKFSPKYELIVYVTSILKVSENARKIEICKKVPRIHRKH